VVAPCRNGRRHESVRPPSGALRAFSVNYAPPRLRASMRGIGLITVFPKPQVSGAIATDRAAGRT
jgi:hypothetical protein